VHSGDCVVWARKTGPQPGRKGRKGRERRPYSQKVPKTPKRERLEKPGRKTEGVGE